MKHRRIPPDQRHRAFAREYVKDHNAKQAALRAGYSKHTAQAQGSRLLTYADVREEVARLEREAGDMAQIEAVKLLRENARLAFCDPRRLFHPDGQTKAPHELDDDTAAAVVGIERSEEEKGKRRRKVVTFKYRLLDKNPALERLFKYKGLYKEAAPLLPSEEDDGPENVLDTARRIAFVFHLALRQEKKKTPKRR